MLDLVVVCCVCFFFLSLWILVDFRLSFSVRLGSVGLTLGLFDFDFCALSELSGAGSGPLQVSWQRATKFSKRVLFIRKD
jgi:hypothetical protein